jgi:phosphoglycolate phosphatase
VAPSLEEARFRDLSERYRHHYLAREPEIPMFAGAVEMIDTLRAAGCLLGVATGKSRRGLDRALATTGLASRFDATRCADEGRPKPHPDMLLHLMERLGARPEETVMVGDTTHDIALARNAGAAALAVAYGAHAREALEISGASAVVESIAEVQAWLMKPRR